MIVLPLFCLLFVGTATLVLLFIGCLVNRSSLGANVLPEFFSTLTSSQRLLLRTWIIGGGFIGVLVPLSVAIVLHANEIVQYMLLPYIGVLLIQIISERLLVRIFGSLMSPITGLIYTVFRIFHLVTLLFFWQGTVALLVPEVRTILTSVLLTNLLFWSCNLLFLSIAVQRMTQSHFSSHRVCRHKTSQ